MWKQANRKKLKKPQALTYHTVTQQINSNTKVIMEYGFYVLQKQNRMVCTNEHKQEWIFSGTSGTPKGYMLAGVSMVKFTRRMHYFCNFMDLLELFKCKDRTLNHHTCIRSNEWFCAWIPVLRILETSCWVREKVMRVSGEFSPSLDVFDIVEEHK